MEEQAMVVCERIEKVKNGYIVKVRFPFGDYSDNGQVICKDFKDVVKLLKQSAGETD